MKATMMKAHAMAQTSPAMTGNHDEDFAAMDVCVAEAQIMMARVEMQCGHRAADRKSAAMLLRESQERLQMFRDQAQS